MKTLIAVLLAITLTGCTTVRVQRTENIENGKVVSVVTNLEYDSVLQNKEHGLNLTKDNTDGSILLDFKANTNNDPAVQLAREAFELGKKAGGAAAGVP